MKKNHASVLPIALLILARLPLAAAEEKSYSTAAISSGVAVSSAGAAQLAKRRAAAARIAIAQAPEVRIRVHGGNQPITVIKTGTADRAIETAAGRRTGAAVLAHVSPGDQVEIYGLKRPYEEITYPPVTEEMPRFRRSEPSAAMRAPGISVDDTLQTATTNVGQPLLLLGDTEVMSPPQPTKSTLTVYRGVDPMLSTRNINLDAYHGVKYRRLDPALPASFEIITDSRAVKVERTSGAAQIFELIDDLSAEGREISVLKRAERTGVAAASAAAEKTANRLNVGLNLLSATSALVAAYEFTAGYLSGLFEDDDRSVSQRTERRVAHEHEPSTSAPVESPSSRAVGAL